MRTRLARLRKRLTPPLFVRHRGFALVATGMMFFHLIAGLDHLLLYSRHTSPAWKILKESGGLHLWGWIHLAMALALLLGLYLESNNLFLVRVVCSLTLTVAVFIGGSFIAGAFLYGTTMFGVAGAVLAFFCSAAAIMEPAVQPLSTPMLRRKD